MKQITATTALVTGFILAAVSTVEANSWNFTGSRYQAMGGTGVAYSDDSLSAYWNPANLAFQKGWDVQLPVTANGEIVNLAAEKLSDLLQRSADMSDTLEEYVDCSTACETTPTEADKQNIYGLLYDLSRFGQQAESVHVDIEVGILGRYNNFAFSALSMTTATIYPNIDTENVHIGAEPQIWIPCPPEQPGSPPCNAPENKENQYFQSTLSDPEWTSDQIGQLIWSMEKLNDGEELNPEQQNVVRNVVTSDGAFADNQSGALAAGLSTQEFAISWSHTIPVPGFEKMQGTSKKIFSYIHDKVSVGITPKYILGITFLNFYSYQSGETFSDVTNTLVDLDSREISHNFGLDLGLSLRPVDWLQIGIVARNVNSPEFDIRSFQTRDGRVIDAFELAAQARLGVAVRPFKNLLLSSDIDLTLNKIDTIPGFKSRLLSIGAEYRIGLTQNSDLSLRLGTFGNLSTSRENDWSLTGGLGIRIGSFVMDFSGGGQFSDNLVRTGSTSYQDLPSGLNLGLGFKWEKSL